MQDELTSCQVIYTKFSAQLTDLLPHAQPLPHSCQLVILQSFAASTPTGCSEGIGLCAILHNTGVDSRPNPIMLEQSQPMPLGTTAPATDV